MTVLSNAIREIESTLYSKKERRVTYRVTDSVHMHRIDRDVLGQIQLYDNNLIVGSLKLNENESLASLRSVLKQERRDQISQHRV